jgi:hypothetical protein
MFLDKVTTTAETPSGYMLMPQRVKLSLEQGKANINHNWPAFGDFTHDTAV